MLRCVEHVLRTEEEHQNNDNQLSMCVSFNLHVKMFEHSNYKIKKKTSNTSLSASDRNLRAPATARRSSSDGLWGAPFGRRPPRGVTRLAPGFDLPKTPQQAFAGQPKTSLRAQEPQNYTKNYPNYSRALRNTSRCRPGFRKSR